MRTRQNGPTTACPLCPRVPCGARIPYEFPCIQLPRTGGAPQQPSMTQPVYLGLGHKAFDSGNPSVAD